jgi:hypothetical protein
MLPSLFLIFLLISLHFVSVRIQPKKRGHHRMKTITGIEIYVVEGASKEANERLLPLYLAIRLKLP